MIEKSTGDFMGWTGLKFVTQMRNGHTNYYDLGYRMMPRYWGKGYATESAIPCVEYGFNDLKLETIYGMGNMNNIASRKVLEKAGLYFVNTFDDEGFATGWYELSKQDWLFSIAD